MNITTQITLLLTSGAILSQPLGAAPLPAVAHTEEATEAITQEAQGQGKSKEELAKQLANPVAALISLPMQFNYDSGYGPNDNGDQWLVNVQPVIPFSLNDDWNLISRTILPIIRRDDIPNGRGVQSGIGDIVQSAFFSPKMPVGGWILGAGPVFLLPTGTNDLSSKKWGVGPTGVALRQQGPWTYGGLFNHIWSTGGSNEVVDDINQTFIQPFVTYTTPGALSITAMTETTYDWNNEQWSVPVHLIATKMGKIGNQMVSYGAGVHYWAESPDNGPEGFGFRLVFTFLWPK